MFSVVRVGQSVTGRPMLHIEPAPLNSDGIPEVGDELAAVITPYMKNTDNISLRFMDCGLPTTTTAVIGVYEVGTEEFSVSYELRIMLFETATRKIGSNLSLRPVQRHGLMVAVPVSQTITGARTYEFREVYESKQQAEDDLDRLAQIAHRHFCGDGGSNKVRFV